MAIQSSHVNAGGHARMVDVGSKPKTLRRAKASAVVRLNPQTLEAIISGGVPKGDVLAVAQVAGIMAAKKTPELIPLCHAVALTGVDLCFFVPDEANGEITITSEVSCTGETGVEMEALAAVAAAALTIYDMCKSLQRDIVIGEIMLLEKSGGSSGDYRK